MGLSSKPVGTPLEPAETPLESRWNPVGTPLESCWNPINSPLETHQKTVLAGNPLNGVTFVITLIGKVGKTALLEVA